MSIDSLEVEFPVMRYDITMPLLEGRVPIDGVKLKSVKSSSMVNKEDPKIKRLFANYVDEDQKLYRETGIYTPVHMIVMSRKLDREQPELAAKFYAAFEKAKQIAYDDIASDRGGFSVVYLRERMKEQTAAWGDPWKYGIKANKTTIDAFIKYNVDQGMIRSAPSHAEIFAAGTLDT